MIKKEMIAMLLAGGQGSRLGVLTEKVAKPAVAFGGKYRIIDFPLSNCINSGIDTVGVLTQYQPLRLNTHIGIGIPWDLDRNEGGVTVLPPYEKSTSSEWYTGTANAIFQNMDYMEQYNPDYVLILSVMVRNSFGAVIVILLLLIGAGPIIHYGSLSLVYRFLAAIAQPISDKRVVGALSTMGEGCAMLLKLLLTAEVLCMLTFLIVVVSVS